MLFVELDEPLLHVLVDLTGARVGCLEHFWGDTSKLVLLGAKVRNKVVQKLN